MKVTLQLQIHRSHSACRVSNLPCVRAAAAPAKYLFNGAFESTWISPSFSSASFCSAATRRRAAAAAGHSSAAIVAPTLAATCSGR
eukprot:6181817-Pleurochrysis_carterae.AAC.4